MSSIFLVYEDGHRLFMMLTLRVSTRWQMTLCWSLIGYYLWHQQQTLLLKVYVFLCSNDDIVVSCIFSWLPPSELAWDPPGYIRYIQSRNKYSLTQTRVCISFIMTEIWAHIAVRFIRSLYKHSPGITSTLIGVDWSQRAGVRPRHERWSADWCNGVWMSVSERVSSLMLMKRLMLFIKSSSG